ncbi:hypothetical protein BHM03_00010846 [Ensete ventricosum]|nr:hypothetical protein BHM03_00010846 [Ensete ventricosum]
MRRDQPAICVRRDKTPVVARYSRTTSARLYRNDQKGEKASESMRAMVGSCTKKTTTMSTAQVVFCKTLVDGVMGVEVEDAVAGSGTKKTTTRAAGSATVSVKGSPEV